MHAFYAERDGGPFMLFSPWPAPNLAPYGFGLVGHPPLMARPAGPIAGGVALDGVEIRQVTDGPTARDWERAIVEGYPEPALQPYRPGCFLPETALTAGGWTHWVAYLDGAAVGTASAFVGSHHVDVELISTMPAARGRGIGRALTATATVAAPELPAMLISSDLGRPVYARLGYMPITRFTLWAGFR